MIGADRVLPATAAPGSIQDELRAYNSMEPSRCSRRRLALITARRTGKRVIAYLHRHFGTVWSPSPPPTERARFPVVGLSPMRAGEREGPRSGGRYIRSRRTLAAQRHHAVTQIAPRPCQSTVTPIIGSLIRRPGRKRRHSGPRCARISELVQPRTRRYTQAPWAR